MSQPDERNDSETPPSAAPRAAIGRVFAVLGTAVASALLVGILVSCANMIELYRTFSELGVPEPKGLVPHLGKALVPVVGGFAVGVFGLLTSFLTALFSSYRARWFFGWSLAFSIAYALIPPLGTLVGAAFGALLVFKRREFLAAAPEGAP